MTWNGTGFGHSVPESVSAGFVSQGFFALTAMVIHWDSETQGLIKRISGSSGEARFPRVQPLSADRPAPDFDAILAAAQKA